MCVCVCICCRSSTLNCMWWAKLLQLIQLEKMEKEKEKEPQRRSCSGMGSISVCMCELACCTLCSTALRCMGQKCVGASSDFLQPMLLAFILISTRAFSAWIVLLCVSQCKSRRFANFLSLASPPRRRRRHSQGKNSLGLASSMA